MKNKIKGMFFKAVKWCKKNNIASLMVSFSIMTGFSIFLGTFIWLVIIYYVTHGSGVYEGQPVIKLQPEMQRTVIAATSLMLTVPSFFSLAIMFDTLREVTAKKMLKYLAMFFVIVVIAFSVLLAVTTKLLTTEGNIFFVLIYCFIIAFIIIYCLKWLFKTIWNWLTDKNSSPVKVNNDKLKIVWTVIVTLMGWLLFKR
ncbi:hypothetical protein [Lactiplantibacillus plantarum]|uniref:hypothetical protein n=1 Tax=Lactiplantibacillus plantarum TaxID=1590 RepID=UPI0009761CA3|nr:hypothetical protein [Lactiplantibacillus plantarum]